MGFLSKLFGRKDEPMRDVAALVAPFARPAIRIEPTGAGANSWAGGAPTVPADFEWPRKNGEPLTFLAQFDLAEVATAHRFDWLPASGTLRFFYDTTEFPWGFDPADAGGWHVHYAPADAELSTCGAPTDADPAMSLDRRTVEFHGVRVPPGPERPEIEALGFDYRELDEFVDARSGPFDAEHQIGGFPSPVQGDAMELECQLASHGLYCGDSSGYEDPRAADLEPGAADWRLLFQFDSDDELDVMWGDCGMLYFWVREEDARRADFRDVWMILQCG